MSACPFTPRVNHHPPQSCELAVWRPSNCTISHPRLNKGLDVPQTKRWEGGTIDEMRIFDRLFHVSWPKWSTHPLKSASFEIRITLCSSVPTLRLVAMWETTFPRNTHAGFCKQMYESNIPFSIGYGRKVLTKSGVGISRKCCFPHGLVGANLHK
jgi:hypothetical protein